VKRVPTRRDLPPELCDARRRSVGPREKVNKNAVVTDRSETNAVSIFESLQFYRPGAAEIAATLVLCIVPGALTSNFRRASPARIIKPSSKY